MDDITRKIKKRKKWMTSNRRKILVEIAVAVAF